MILLWCDLLVTNMDIHNAKSNESSKEVYAHLCHQLHWALLHQSLECMSGASTCRLMRWLFAQHVSRLVVASHISKPQAHWTILVIFVLIVAQIMHKCLCKNEGSIYIYILEWKVAVSIIQMDDLWKVGQFLSNYMLTFKPCHFLAHPLVQMPSHSPAYTGSFETREGGWDYPARKSLSNYLS